MIPVHLFGQCADMDALGRIRSKSGVPVVEDAAQSIGAEFDGRRAGSIGEIGCLSFYPTKNLGGAGDGGMLTTSATPWPSGCGCCAGTACSRATTTAWWASTAASIRSRPRCSTSSCRTSIAGRKCGKRTPSDIHELFAAARLDRVLVLPGLRAPAPPRLEPVRGPRPRRQARSAPRSSWPKPRSARKSTIRSDCTSRSASVIWATRPGTLPDTYRAAREVLALPIFPEFTAEEQRLVVDRIAAFYEGSTPSHAITGPHFLKQPQGHTCRGQPSRVDATASAA